MATYVRKFYHMLIMANHVTLRNARVRCWPNSEAQVTITSVSFGEFDGPANINETLARTVLDLENDPRFVVKLQRGGCGTKIDHIHRWKVPEATLIHARAISFFVNGLGFDQGVVDQCWANIYRKGDYCMPHSHVRCMTGIVYLVDPGDHDPDSPIDGKFYFCDPRLKSACDDQVGCLTNLIMPNLKPGSMISFPGPMVHGVNPYFGDRPRITLSWNFNRDAVPGKPVDFR